MHRYLRCSIPRLCSVSARPNDSYGPYPGLAAVGQDDGMQWLHRLLRTHAICGNDISAITRHLWHIALQLSGLRSIPRRD